MKHLAAAATFSLLTACVIPTSMHRANTGTCSARAIDLVRLQAIARPQVVVVRSDIGVGTGFVVAGGDARALTIVTNHHVVRDGRAFQIDLTSENGALVTLANVEIVKVDPAADLAIIRVPRLPGMAAGLKLAPSTPMLGESIAAIGYPYVPGSEPTMTVERGDVTANERVIQGERYVQTNANINPGNSGGPVLDACGAVVGVVVARLSSTERMGLVIPAEKVRALIAATNAAPKDPQELARKRLDGFLLALADTRDGGLGDHLSSAYLEQRIAPLFNESLEKMSAKLTEVKSSLARRGLRFEELTDEQLDRVLTTYFSVDELISVRLAHEMSQGRIDSRQATRIYFAALSTSLFGRVHGHRIDRVQIQGRDARAVVQLSTDKGAETWVLDLIEEWGDWRLAGFSKA